MGHRKILQCSKLPLVQCFMLRGSSIFNIYIPFSLQVLFLTMARGDTVLTGLMLMPHQDLKARLSSVCLAKAVKFKDALRKHLPEQSLQKEKQFTSFQMTAGKLCGERLPSKRSLCELHQEPPLPSSRAIPKTQTKGASELSTSCLSKLLLPA